MIHLCFHVDLIAIAKATDFHFYPNFFISDQTARFYGQKDKMWPAPPWSPYRRTVYKQCGRLLPGPPIEELFINNVAGSSLVPL